jgi:sulfite exporter TauE/SafE
VLTVIVGLALTGWMPGIDLSRHFNGCAFKQLGGAGWFRSLLRGPGILPRLLLGAIMGLLPCGLVYAALLMAAALPTPWHAAGGMILFGVGTLPSLSAVLIASRAAPPKWRAHGTRLAAVFAITPDAGCPCGHGARTQAAPALPQPQSGTPR